MKSDKEPNLKTGNVIIDNRGGSRKYLVLSVDEFWEIVQMVDIKGNIREDVIENYKVIDNVDLSKLEN